MAVYSYTRTSEVEEFEAKSELASILEQEQLQHHTYALSEGMNIVTAFLDKNQNWSKHFDQRQQASHLFDILESGDIILVTDIERIFSNCEDLYQCLLRLKKKKVKLIITSLKAELTDPNISFCFSSMLDIFHNLEKRRSTERIKTVKLKQRNKGRFLGGSRPFGYMIHSNGKLIENPIEQKVLKRILRMKQQGKSLRAISSEVSTPVAPVSFKTVQRLIKRNEASAVAS